jgi:nucleoside-diphosphate-sugar epimerase
MKLPKVAIIGCGYIGTELAILWAKKGFQITATSASLKKIKLLSKLVQKASIYKGTNDATISQILLENDVIVLTLSSNRHGDIEQTFLRTAQFLRKSAMELNIPKTLIYTSNMSVYGDQMGLWVQEDAPLKAATLQGKLLIETENTYLSLSEWGWQVSIFRLGEIYGPGREISKRVKELEGKVLPGTGNVFTNMVHQEDVVKAIDYAYSRELSGVYNLVDDDHPMQKDFYDMVAQKFHLRKVLWDPTLVPMNGNKRLSNIKIKKEGFRFTYPHRLMI